MSRGSAAPGRMPGLVLLLVAVLTAVIVPRVNGTPTGGSPVAATVDPPPRIGYCISHLDTSRAVTRSAQARLVPIPSAVYGTCNAPIAGEVLSVQPVSDLGDEASLEAYDSASAGCSHGIDSYLGSPSGLNGRSGVTEWLPAARYNTLLVGPNRIQRAAGRTWTACVVTSVASTSYFHSVRDAVRDGSLQDQFGYCLNSTDLSDWVPCSAAHSAQVLAWGTPVTSGASPSRADCLAAAAALMESSDPTKEGVLDVGLISYEGVGAVQACGVRVDDGRRLIGSVIGIRGRSPAWSG